jgi:uncharacterized protein (DUF58 family)
MAAFVDPAVLASVRDLSLVARTIVDGFMYGVHQGTLLGVGLEFSQFRSYQPGDDPRRIDWKLAARSNRYFVRESETETSITVRLVLDTSASMAHEEDGVRKFSYARMVAAAIATLGHRQGDAVGLVLARSPAPSVIQPSRDPRHIHRLYDALERAEPAGAWPGWATVEPLLAGPRGMLLIISDLHERSDEITAAASRLAALGHEVGVIQVLGPREVTLDYQGAVTLEDLETGERIECEPAEAAGAYHAAFEVESARQRDALVAAGAGLAQMRTDEPVDGALRRYLIARTRVA